jgi:hypothetical protein
MAKQWNLASNFSQALGVALMVKALQGIAIDAEIVAG